MGTKKEINSKKAKPRRSQAVPLDAAQIARLARLWNEYPGGIEEFARETVKRETGAKSVDDEALANPVRHLRRIEDGPRTVSRIKFKVYAEIL